MKTSTFKLFNIFILTIIFSIIYGCAGSTAGGNNEPIKGVVTNSTPGSKIYLEPLGVSSREVIDSAILGEGGEFTFSPVLKEKMFYRVVMGSEHSILLVMDSTESVDLTFDFNSFMTTYKVEGSEDSKLLKEMNGMMLVNRSTKDSLNNIYRENYNNINEEMINQFRETLQSIDLKFAQQLKSFITTNSTSIVCLAAIEQLSIDNDFDIFKLVDESLGDKYATSAYFKAFHTKYEYNAKFSIGKSAPDIILPDPNGNSMSLSSLRGKYVLIDFWASWCKPCRAENPNVVRLYNQYKGENFEILGVSLDKQKNAWLQAIDKDKLSWKHVSDLMFWQSPVVKLYNISGIPHTLLIDGEGKIIAKNLRGKQLADKLKELFG